MSTYPHTDLLLEIDAFLAESGMGPSYFGKVATGNSEIVARLRQRRRIWPDTEQRVRDFIRTRQSEAGGAQK